METGSVKWFNSSKGYGFIDGLSDLIEMLGTNNTAFNNESTNPNLADGDGDGLTDLEEILGTNNTSFNNESTNPNLSDTDGDSIGDLAEINAGTNPNDPLDPPPSNGEEDGVPPDFTVSIIIALTLTGVFIGIIVYAKARPEWTRKLSKKLR